MPSVPLVPGGLKVTKVKTQRELESTILRRTGKDHWNQWGSTNNFPQKANLDTKENIGGVRWKKARGRLSRYVLQVCGAMMWLKIPRKGQKEFVTFNDPKTKGLEATFKGADFPIIRMISFWWNVLVTFCFWMEWLSRIWRDALTDLNLNSPKFPDISCFFLPECQRSYEHPPMNWGAVLQDVIV